MIARPSNRPTWLPLPVALTLTLLVSACPQPTPKPAVQLELAGRALGTSWSVTAAYEASAPTDAIEARILQTLDRIDRGMSTWREDAELYRFNHRSDRGPFELSPETAHVLSAALELARDTGGAFDPTVGPMVALWGFGADAREQEPSAADIEAARAQVGWQRVSLSEGGRVQAQVGGLRLDLSAIAKGYAVDAVLEELALDRPAGLLVEIGGEVRVLGRRGDGSPWRVGVGAPTASPDSAEQRVDTVAELGHGALATSGDYRQRKVVAGRARSHIIDPRTGQPTDNGVRSVSVVAPTCMEGDAVATALMVLGPDEGLRYVDQRPWLEALFLIETDSATQRRGSAGWSRRIRHSADERHNPN
jgi:thiamine biosynthesis lipoprotein